MFCSLAHTAGCLLRSPRHTYLPFRFDCLGDLIASRRVRSLLRTKAVNPPVEVVPAITSAILAMHTGHMGISPFA
jgi:hypothetical protein